jgi:hypothetical protein
VLEDGGLEVPADVDLAAAVASAGILSGLGLLNESGSLGLRSGLRLGLRLRLGLGDGLLDLGGLDDGLGLRDGLRLRLGLWLGLRGGLRCRCWLRAGLRGRLRLRLGLGLLLAALEEDGAAGNATGGNGNGDDLNLPLSGHGALAEIDGSGHCQHGAGCGEEDGRLHVRGVGYGSKELIDALKTVFRSSLMLEERGLRYVVELVSVIGSCQTALL